MPSMRCFAFLGLLLVFPVSALTQTMPNDGLNNSLSNLYRLSDAQTFSISPENLTGEKGKGAMATQGTGASAARDLGQGWKITPSIRVEPVQTLTLADISSSGAIQHIWLTPTEDWRLSISRIYWDGERDPSVEVPVTPASPRSSNPTGSISRSSVSGFIAGIFQSPSVSIATSAFPARR